MNEKVISDRPVGSEPAGEPAPDPVPDKSTRVSRGSAFRLTGMKQSHAGAVDFNKGVASLRSRELNNALALFEAAIAAEPDNALYQYYLAMTLFGLSGAEAGQEALVRAVALEQQQPIADWGKRMEREQGRGRAWVEKARRDAGITK
jgi:tetratricopeptide (TPR) repeat protein